MVILDACNNKKECVFTAGNCLGLIYDHIPEAKCTSKVIKLFGATCLLDKYVYVSLYTPEKYHVINFIYLPLIVSSVMRVVILNHISRIDGRIMRI